MRRVAQCLSDRLKIPAGHNENLPVLSDSPAVGNTKNLHLFSMCGE